MDDIKVIVLGVSEDRVKVGIEAPTYVPVLREELLGRGTALMNG